MHDRDHVEEVRARTDLLALIGADVALNRAGSVYKGRSPWNRDETPSFVVWPESGRWRDYSGGEEVGGDCFDYVQRRDGVGFGDALRLLAARCGVEIPAATDPALAAELDKICERRRVEALLTEAAGYYHRALPSKVRAAWFREHYGFTDATIDTLQLGWADGHLHAYLADHATAEELLATGLFVRRRDGSVVDFFRDRLVFPYWRGGRVAYFIARRTQLTGDEPWEAAKYKKLLTRSERHPYVSTHVQNAVFYNEDAARRAETLVITEGVTDCIAAMQAGVACVSPVTTRFRAQDLPRLLQLTEGAARVVLCNDAEESGAGEAGALQTAEALFEAGRDVRLVTLPRPPDEPKVDVNSFLQAHDATAFLELVEAAPRYLEHRIAAVPAETSPLDLPAALTPILDALAGRTALEQDAYLDLIRSRFKLSRRAVADLRRAIPNPSSPTPTRDEDTPSVSVRGEIFEEIDHYTVRGRGGEVVVISSFHLEPVERVRREDGEHIIADVTTTGGKVYRGMRFAPRAWHSKRSFIASFGTADMQWMGSDDNVQALLGIVSRRAVPLREGVSAIGYVERTAGEPRVLFPDLVLGPEGLIEDDALRLMGADEGLVRVLRLPVEPPEVVAAVAAEALPLLLELNTPAVTLPLIGWFFAAPFKPRLMATLQHFPILWVWGTRGSGKTSMCKEVFWRLSGVQSRGAADAFSVSQTQFALLSLLAASTSVPIFLDEYRPDDMRRADLGRIHRTLRSLYGGEVDRRGRADLKVSSFHICAPVCVGGEARPDDPALLDRLISVTPDPNTLHERPTCVRAFERLRRLDLAALAVPIAALSLRRDIGPDLEVAARVVDEVIAYLGAGEKATLRGRDNLQVMVFGLLIFESFAAEHGVSLPELQVEVAIAACIDDLMDGDRGAKTALDHFVEACATMAFEGELVEDRHWAQVGELTCLHLRSCWTHYLEHQRRTGQQADAALWRPLQRMIRENLDRGGYVKDRSRLVSLGGRRVRTLALDLGEAASFLDVDGFEPREQRSWGGYRD